MRRRTKRKYTWFPVLGGDTASDGEGLELSTATRGIPCAKDGTVTTDIFPLIPDQSHETDIGGGRALVDFVGTSWFIKRLVGKVHISYEQNLTAPSGSGGAVATIPAACVVVAGFFVARQDATQPSVPIGDDANLNEDYSPLALATQREPWIWRRSWILGNNIAAGTNVGLSPPAGFNFPATNASRSVYDGPHIDAKTARRSQNDERLWFALSTWQWPTALIADNDGQLSYTLDLRILGALRRQRNRSAF